MICRFTTFVFACLMASASASPFAPAQSKNDGKSAYVSNLLRKATPTEGSIRRLNDDEEMDLTPWSIKFMQCQFVKAYDDDMADDADGGSVLGTTRLVTFRLCDSCDDSCNTYGQYAEYMIDLEAYLEATVAYYQEQQEEYCQACEECGNEEEQEDQGDEEDDGGRRRLVDCDTCYATCQGWENLEENGYVDAAEYLECQQMGEADDDGSAYYAGPICSSGGSEIKIGVFTDEFCSVFANDGTSIDDLLAAEAGDDENGVPQLSYHTLGEVGEGSCVSCVVVDEDADQNDEPEANEMCQALYEDAGKCETPTGFKYGVLSFNDEEYYNQIAQEDTVCGFIKAVNSGAYDEEGEISLSSGNVSAGGGSSVTGGQKVVLAVLIIGTVGLIGFAASLHSSLTKGAKADLSSSGGAMA